jgi:hypothetical protein
MGRTDEGIGYSGIDTPTQVTSYLRATRKDVISSTVRIRIEVLSFSQKRGHTDYEFQELGIAKTFRDPGGRERGPREDQWVKGFLKPIGFRMHTVYGQRPAPCAIWGLTNLGRSVLDAEDFDEIIRKPTEEEWQQYPGKRRRLKKMRKEWRDRPKRFRLVAS